MVISCYLGSLNWELGEKDQETEAVVMDHMTSSIRPLSKGAGKIEIEQW